ncbi:hypothetical protein K1718_27470 (plasmid) [Roseibium porphyridii]|uniref:Uncharacterized protein n=1 Tax=Roseibium porphyridii TaxID=2866279 RepID=A0ABY8FEL4_9HYPH|nr:hypothetical protein [Roseibium sp. KMA01]WFE92642.1 hypothetical protein K1718_27470 [Roseibium sp. KMA01]
MAVHVPAMVVVGALRAIQQQSNNRQLAQQQSIEMMRLKMEIDAQDRQRERQAQLLSKLVDVAQDMHNKKIDAVMEIFRGVKEVLLDQQRIFDEEKKDIRQASYSASSDGFVLMKKRQKEIDRELANIRTAIEENANAAYAMIASIEPALPSSTAMQIEDLRRV